VGNRLVLGSIREVYHGSFCCPLFFYLGLAGFWLGILYVVYL